MKNVYQLFALAVISIVVALSATAQQTSGDGALDPSFAPFITGANVTVRAVAVQPDGKILVGGSFVQISDTRIRSFARLNSDGSLDTSFNQNSVGANGGISIIKLFPDGKILIVGSFTSYNGAARNGAAKLNADGSLDTSFNPDTANLNAPSDVIIQPDNKIVLGQSSSFYTFPPQPSQSSQSTSPIRLNADGSRDQVFNQNAASLAVSSSVLALQPDGKILTGGFDRATCLGCPVPKSLARLNADGTLDASFDAGTGINGSLNKIIVQPDNKILLGGSFTTYNNVTVYSLVRINPNGSLETAFAPPTADANNIEITGLTLQPDNKILFGLFYLRTGNQLSLPTVRRLNADGSIDSTFAPSSAVVATVSNIALQPDGKVLLFGGNSSVIFSSNTVSSIALTRLDSSGNADNSFAPRFAGVGSITNVVPLPDGKVIIGGSFSAVGNTPITNIARLNPDSSLDASFKPNINLIISKITRQSDGKLLLGGRSSFSNGSNIGIVRLNADGSNDSSFASPLKSFSQVSDIVVQPDNKVLIIGNLTTANSSSTRAILRLNADGSLDSTFDFSDASLSVVAAAVQPDGKILIGGYPAVFNSSTITVRRILTNGAADTTFAASADIVGVNQIELQKDGRILIAGTINNSKNTSGLAKLNADGSFDASFGVNGKSIAVSDVSKFKSQPDGRILYSSGSIPNLVGGGVIIISLGGTSSFGRLNRNGFVDNSFALSTSVSINDIALQADNKILIGGNFASYNNSPAYSVARLNNSLRFGSTAFDYDADGRSDLAVFRPANRVWYLLNSTAGFSGVQFGLATDKLVSADFDGDGKTDIAVYRDGVWFWINSSTNSVSAAQFGTNGDIPVAADYDNDGKADLAVFRPSNGTWYVQRSRDGFTAAQFGQNGDIPVAGDYDGDGKTDFAVYRPSNNVWYLLKSTEGFAAAQFGTAGDIVTPGDYDGDGQTDIAVWRPSNGTWYLQQSKNGFTGFPFGQSGDVPVAADYDGDGRTDAAVYRNGVWYLQQSTQGFRAAQFGLSDDKPTPASGK